MALGYLMAFGSLVFWGLNIVAARELAVDVPPAALSFWRWSVATLLLVWMIPRIWQQRQEIVKHWKHYAQLGATGIATFHVCIYLAAQTTSVYTIALIAATSGIFVKVFALILGQRMSVFQLLGALATLTGLAILLTQGELLELTSFEIVKGDLWMLLGAAIWAYYSMVLERRPRGLPFDNHVAAMWFGLPMLAVLYATEFSTTGSFEPNQKIVLIILYLAVFPSILCYWLWATAINRIGAVRAHAMYYLLPLVCAAEAWLILDDKLHWYHLAAAVAIIGGALSTHQRLQR